MAELHTEPVKTFSVGFREDTNNELHDARTIANHFGTDHHELELSFLDDTIDLPDLVWHLDEPVADLSALGFLALSQLARQHVTVALSGQGADELFAGYERYRNAALAGRWRRLPPWSQQAARSLLSVGPRKARRAAAVFTASTPFDLLVALYGRESDEVDAVRRGSRDRVASMLAERFGQLSAGDPLETTLYLDAQLALPDDMLHYFDRTSMAHSLEVRVPFLDHPLVEWAATVPTTLKLRRDTTKYVLKETARHLLPTFAIDKPKMGFFNASLDRWLEHQAASLADTHLLDAEAHVESLVDIEVLREFVHGSPAQRRIVFRVLILELWLERTSASLPLARSA